MKLPSSHGYLCNCGRCESGLKATKQTHAVVNDYVVYLSGNDIGYRTEIPSYELTSLVQLLCNHHFLVKSTKLGAKFLFPNGMRRVANKKRRGLTEPNSLGLTALASLFEGSVELEPEICAYLRHVSLAHSCISYSADDADVELVTDAVRYALSSVEHLLPIAAREGQSLVIEPMAFHLTSKSPMHHVVRRGAWQAGGCNHENR